VDKRSETLHWLKKTLSELTGNPSLFDELRPSSSLEAIGIHSISFIRLVVEIEQRFDVVFSDEEMVLYNFPSVDALLERIVQLQSA